MTSGHLPQLPASNTRKRDANGSVCGFHRGRVTDSTAYYKIEMPTMSTTVQVLNDGKRVEVGQCVD